MVQSCKDILLLPGYFVLQMGILNLYKDIYVLWKVIFYKGSLFFERVIKTFMSGSLFFGRGFFYIYEGIFVLRKRILGRYTGILVLQKEILCL